MSAPKKKDLSSLKARLAKKAAVSAPADVPAPGQVVSPPAPEPEIPPPGQSLPADIPAPGQSMPAEVPAPGYVAEPEPAPIAYEPEPEPAAAGGLNEAGDPYSGGQSFDPGAGLISDSGGDIAPRKSTGLALTALAGGVAIGALLGFFGNEVTSKNKMKARAVAKAAVMLEEVERVKKTRTEISLEFDEVVKAIDKDPAAGTKKLTDLLVSKFGPDSDFPKVESLFGWQLSSLHPKTIKSAFALYKNSQDLVVDMGFLAQYVNANGKVLAGRGPTSYMVVLKPEGAVMVEYVGALCAGAGEGEGRETRRLPALTS